MLTAVTRLALASYSQDKDRIESGHERVQRDIAMRGQDGLKGFAQLCIVFRQE